MEAVEKNDFQDLVTSEEEPTTAVTADVEDEIIQQILTSEDEVETTEVAESEELEEGILDDDDIEALSDEEGWEDIAEDDLAEMEAFLAELKKDNPDLDLDNVDIVMNEDGEIEVYEASKKVRSSRQVMKDMGVTAYRKKQKKQKLANIQRSRKPPKRRKSGPVIKRITTGASFDPSEVSADSAVAMGEEDIDEYTANTYTDDKGTHKAQTRPTNVTVWRTVGGELKKVKRWTSRGQKGINKGPKSAAHKKAIAKAMKRSWKSGAAKKAHGGGGSKEESFDATEVVTALSTGEELSETFKEKASTIFEAAVNTEVDKHMETAEVEVQQIFEEEFDKAVGDITSKVDSYLDYVVEEWIKENEVAIESGIRSEIAEDFIGGLKTLFTQNYIDVPETKVDVVEELGQKVKELEDKLNTEISSNIALKQELSEHKRDEVIQSLSSEMTVAEVEKLKELSEGISFEDSSDFATKITTLKENYFPTVKAETSQEELLTEETDFETLSNSMDAYTKVLSSTVQS